MVKCSFCGSEIAKGTGLMFVKKDAKILYFCSRKCEKNMLALKRKPRNVTWTEEAHKAKSQTLSSATKHTKPEKKTEKKNKSLSDKKSDKLRKPKDNNSKSKTSKTVKSSEGQSKKK